MSTGPCDVKLSQDQRRFIKKSRQEEERINPDALLKECEQKLTAFFFITVNEKIILGVRNT